MCVHIVCDMWNATVSPTSVWWNSSWPTIFRSIQKQHMHMIRVKNWAITTDTNSEHCMLIMNIFKTIQNYPELSRTIQNYPKLFRTIQNYSEIFRTTQTCSELLRPIQNYSEQFKTIKNYSEQVRNIQIPISLTDCDTCRTREAGKLDDASNAGGAVFAHEQLASSTRIFMSVGWLMLRKLVNLVSILQLAGLVLLLMQAGAMRQ